MVLIAAAGMAVAGCSSINTQPDQAGLQYSAGSFSDTEFGECVKPGTHEFYGPGDKTYVYPQGQRTYNFSSESGGADRPPIKITTKDGVEMSVDGLLNFQLNTDCEVLRKFHERIGLKYGADEDGVGQWGDLLDDYLGEPLRSSMTDAAASYTVDELYSDSEKRTEWENAIKDRLPGYIEDLAGGEYFTSFTLVVQRPTPPDSYRNQLNEQLAQQERLDTIEAQRRAQEAEIAQIRQLVEVFGGWEGYIAYRNQVACEQGEGQCVPFIPIPQGSGVLVNPGG
jgi:regulator of protease activity HflC (stomatin/prohibitin superfamily)